MNVEQFYATASNRQTSLRAPPPPMHTQAHQIHKYTYHTGREDRQRRAPG